MLCTICNELDIDLFSSLKDKEKENIERKWKKYDSINKGSESNE